MVKLPHQVNGFVTVNSRFETVMTSDLILQIADGKLKTPEDVSHWVAAHTKPTSTGTDEQPHH